MAGALFCCLALTGCHWPPWPFDSDSKSDSSPPPTPTLAAPANVVATPGDTQVSLQWDAVPDATGYNLCHAEEPITDFANCATFMGGTLLMGVTSPQNVTGLTNGTLYYFRLIATLNGTEGPASVEVSATPVFTPVGGLNDTGIDWCADDSSNFDTTGTPAQKSASCAPLTASHPGQDGMLGRDAIARSDAINATNTLGKIGAGEAGFDYSKVCNSGQIAGEGACPANPALGDGADDWACTRDNVTGLIWEVKVNDNTHLRHNGHSYTWFNSDPTTNGGVVGTVNGGSCSSVGNCDTEKFVDGVNTASLCGANDWRLPSAGGLLSIAHRGRVSPAIDIGFFPNTPSDFYWSSSPYAFDASFAWGVSFFDGFVSAGSKSVNGRVRLVRAGQ